MGIDRLSSSEVDRIAPLFAGWEESLIWSCLQGYMGEAWADNKERPQAARILLADFCYFVGKVNRGLVTEEIKTHSRDFVIMVPPMDETGETWAKEIEDAYGDCCKRVERYAIKKEPGIFDKEKLEKIVAGLEPQYEVKLIDEDIF